MEPTHLPSLAGRDFLSLADLSQEEFSGLIASAIELKTAWKSGVRPALMQHKTLAMIFEKQSLRTRS
ncbi:MAG TPA: ornithine carbamoyltransferase, partial [Trueperaceae bacterium]|nr:ornithine carbamoyltransferase [Trueperaceae bacterium]